MLPWSALSALIRNNSLVSPRYPIKNPRPSSSQLPQFLGKGSPERNIGTTSMLGTRYAVSADAWESVIAKGHRAGRSHTMCVWH